MIPGKKIQYLGISLLAAGPLISYSALKIWTVSNTVKPLLSGPPIKWTPSIKRTLGRIPKLTSYIFLYNEPLFS